MLVISTTTFYNKQQTVCQQTVPEMMT